MIDEKALEAQVRRLAPDLRQQVARDTGLRAELRQEHEDAKAAQRVGGAFEVWLEDVLDQAAVAWVLGCVFVRFCEDNGLVGRLWLGGAAEEAPAVRAIQRQQEHMIANPRHNDRHWLREAFGHLRGLRATGKIFNGHNPVWRFDISGDAAEALTTFFRKGAGAASLHDPELGTRFLGDLYQHLSEEARKTYALLQTPEFVEEFILERTLKPAVDEFGLSGTAVIDPTCGSGHFLLGAFDRLLARWRVREPGTPLETLVERSLGQVTGVDVNPFAVAIARFRLMVAALRACGRTNLNNDYPIRVATGDSLLPWGDPGKGIDQPTLDGKSVFAYATEDDDLLKDYLRPGHYTVVVGNPPYITVADGARNKRYRELYPKVCYRQYALTVPFAQRFFDLARRGDHDGDGAGYVGQITANSFMKREFGKKLINDYLAHEVELTEVIDTSGAYIPGHGTPTVILVGRNRLVSPRYSTPIRAVLGIHGEPSQPADPAQGLVWSAIVKQIDSPTAEPEWVDATDLPRAQLSTHPWSLSGGSATDAQSFMENGRSRLQDAVDLIGYTGQTNADAALLADCRSMNRFRVEAEAHRQVVIGEVVRDFLIGDSDHSVFLYGLDALWEIQSSPGTYRRLWPYRTTLWARRTFGKVSYREEGRQWWEWHQVSLGRLRTPLSIAFAFVATHNHFVLDRGGKVFNRSAPVIKLPEGASEDEHLRLLGVLNSSTACFWLKQVSQPKAGTANSSGGGNRWSPEPWYERYEFTGTKLQEFPLPGAYPLELARELDGLARRLGGVSPAAVAASGVPTRQRLATAREEWHTTRARMIALQEELDWQVYRIYGLTDDELTSADPPPLALGERAFEIVLGREVAAGEAQTVWFNRHGSTPITELPEHWPAEYQDLVRRRIEVIGSDRNIALIERPECKRRWATEGWDAMQAGALRDWLLDRLEAPGLWGDRPGPLSVAQLADRVRHDEDFRAVLELWVGDDQYDLVKTLGKLVADEHVPFLPAYRYKPAGLRKRRLWERTWELQRREDAGDTVDIDVPPRYTSADFTKPSYWRRRGKLDVPKERFISYPGAGRDGDRTDLLGWAGWDHLAQAQALATVYLDRKQQAAWPADRLLPLLAGLAELEPWLHQWHEDPQPGYPGSPADFFTGLIDTELAALGADRATLARIRGIEDSA